MKVFDWESGRINELAVGNIGKVYYSKDDWYDGLFFRDDRNGGPAIYYCRDVFSKRFNDQKSFCDDLIAYNYGAVTSFKRATNLFDKIECKLGLKTRSSIYQTSRKGIIVIKPLRFWGLNFLRRSLFTLLLRSLHRKEMSDKQVQSMFDHFMNGNTKINYSSYDLEDSSDGWLSGKNQIEKHYVYENVGWCVFARDFDHSILIK